MNSDSTTITFNNFICIITPITQAATADEDPHSLLQIKLQHNYTHNQNSDTIMDIKLAKRGGWCIKNKLNNP